MNTTKPHFDEQTFLHTIAVASPLDQLVFYIISHMRTYDNLNTPRITKQYLLL